MTRYVILCPDAHKRCSDLFAGGGETLTYFVEPILDANFH